MAPELPDRARVVVIGGGVIGTSIAYHLAHLGWGSDVVLLERDRLTSGTTWHAAGLMTCFGSFSETSTSMRLYSRELYARLEAETGQATGFKPVGLIEAAADADRLEEYRRVAAFQRHLGLEAVAQLSHERVGVGHLERSQHDVVGHVLQHRHVVAHAALQEAAVLEHRRDLPSPIRVGDVAMGSTVDENSTAVGIVEAAHVQ